MASDGLIDQYLSALAAHMRRREDWRDLVDEVADHLLSSAEHLERAGIDRHEAETRALARFGEPRLVAALLTSTPSKGTVMSLFFARRLGVFAALAALAWAAAAISSFWGLTGLSGSWTQERYLTSAVLVGAACLLTSLVLLGMNLRARGRMDRTTGWILALSLLGTLAATGMSWVVAGWMPVMAAAVTWTAVRCRRAHAGSPAFARALAVLAPACGLTSVGVSLYGILTENGMEAAIWGSVAAFGVLFIAAFTDLVARLLTLSRPARAVAG